MLGGGINLLLSLLLLVLWFFLLLLFIGRFGRTADDLLDVTGTAERLGKAVAKDAAAGKQTYPAAVGVEASRRAAEKAVGQAVKALGVFGPDADDLRQLAGFVVEREK